MANDSAGEQAQGTARQNEDGGGSDEGFFDDIPWKKAATFGAVAFLVGFALVAGIALVEGALDDTQEGVEEEDDDDEISVLSVLGWLFFNTHFVDIEVDGLLGSASVDFLSLIDEEDGLSIPSPVWRLIPIGTLIAAGYLLADRTLPPTADETEGAKRGGTLAAGYLPFVFVGALIFEESFEEGSIGVDLFEALLIAGLIYPIVFGAIGGYLAHREE